MTDLEQYERVADLLVQEKKKNPPAHRADLRAQRMQLLNKLRRD